jgi:hypothetical protein
MRRAVDRVTDDGSQGMMGHMSLHRFYGSLGGLWSFLSRHRQTKPGPGEAGAPNVTGWQEGLDLGAKPFPELVLRVSNEGKFPVHDLKLKVPVGVRGTYLRDIHALDPGETQEVRVAIPAPPRSAQVVPEITFTDTAGNHWLRTVTGELKQLQELPGWDAEPGAYRAEDHPTLHLQSESYSVAS